MSILLTTARLKLFPCTVEIAQAALTNKSHTESLLGVRVSDDWYTCEVQDFFPEYALGSTSEDLLQGWGAWFMVHQHERVLIGDLGFGGKPDETGTVEIGYEVLEAYRHQGYAMEATLKLVEWALTQSAVKRIIAHCTQDNLASIQILKKLGMQQIESVYLLQFPSTLMCKWELMRDD
jgi:[ribosomal protein S5]-alanine N-acetyltransferase